MRLVMKKIFLSCALISMLFVSACEQSIGNKSTIGTGLGAIIGGILGSNVGGGSGQLWAVGAGTLLGALAGSEIGKSLDRADMVYAERAQSKAHNSSIGETITWRNPKNDHGGSVTAVRDGESTETGNYCREYRQTIMIDGSEEVGYGTACQLSDGTWEII